MGLSDCPTSDLVFELLARLAREKPGWITLPIAEIAKRLTPCRHGPDFVSVIWHGKPYYFTPNQAAVVKLLWESWEQGTFQVKQEYLLSEADSDSSRLADLFKDHPAWGSVIKTGHIRGTFRLSDPEPKSD